MRCMLQHSGLQDMSAAELKDIPSRSQAVSTRQEAILEARGHLIAEVNKINTGTEAIVFVFTAPLQEGET